MKVAVREYLDERGESPFAHWFGGLDAIAAAKIATALYRLEQGNFSRVQSVGSGVYEYTINFGPGYRVYFRQGRGRTHYLAWRRFEEEAAHQHCGSSGLLARLQEAEAVGGEVMVMTREFRTTLLERAHRDAEFRKAMLKEGVDAMLAGDVETGKSILRDYINAAVGFGRLSEATHIPAKSLMRMFGPKGNPRADNLFQIIKHLQASEGIRLEVAPC